MKLVKQSGDQWHYRLNEEEAESLCAVIDCFPVAPARAAAISKTHADPATLEREKLLNESLAEHRRELQRKAKTLVAPDKFKVQKVSRIFHITSEDREILLQVLNDVRLDSWHTLGEPETLETDAHKIPAEKLRYYQLLHLSGYFEHHLLENAEG